MFLTLTQKAGNCDPDVCRLPDCYCGGSDIPGGYKPEDIPQFVLLTFDDAVNSLNEKFFQELFKDRLNPNGCPIKVGVHTNQNYKYLELLNWLLLCLFYATSRGNLLLFTFIKLLAKPLSKYIFVACFRPLFMCPTNGRITLRFKIFMLTAMRLPPTQ